MAKVAFTANIQRHVACPSTEVPGATLREVLDNVFAGNPRARAYVLDDQAGVRRHMAIFIDGALIRDRDPIAGRDERLLQIAADAVEHLELEPVV